MDYRYNIGISENCLFTQGIDLLSNNVQLEQEIATWEWSTKATSLVRIQLRSPYLKWCPGKKRLH